MKNLIVCDSGLGGLDVAGHFFAEECDSPEWNIIYINAYPDTTWGYNDLPTPRAQEELFQKVLMSMEKYTPACCLIACNTLSIIWQRLAQYYKPSFPVVGIIETAVAQMSGYMRENPDAHLLILGTKSTVESQVYPAALIEQGFSAKQIHSLACPRLATLIEQDPTAPAVNDRIRQYAIDAKAMFDVPPKQLALVFCCTHYGYATAFWRNAFAEQFGAVDILNPNDKLTLAGAGANFEYHSRIPLANSQKEAMVRFFKQTNRERISVALQSSQEDKHLF